MNARQYHHQSQFIAGQWEKLFYLEYHFIHQLQLAFYFKL